MVGPERSMTVPRPSIPHSAHSANPAATPRANLTSDDAGARRRGVGSDVSLGSPSKHFLGIPKRNSGDSHAIPTETAFHGSIRVVLPSSEGTCGDRGVVPGSFHVSEPGGPEGRNEHCFEMSLFLDGRRH